MASEVSICNLALANLGDSATVASIDPPEGSAQAEHCATFYPAARDTLLEMHSWGFATKRAVLSQLSGTWQGWQFAYALPSDLLRVTDIKQTDSPDFGRQHAHRVSFTIETKSDGTKILLTDTENLTIQYTCSVTDPNKFSALFTNALVWHLASMLAGPVLKGDVGRAESKRCLEMMNVYLSQAKTSDANQRSIYQSYTPSSVRAR